MIKNLGKGLPKRLDLIYIYIKNSSGIIKAWQKTVRTPSKKLAIDSLIYRNINYEKYENDGKNLER